MSYYEVRFVLGSSRLLRPVCGVAFFLSLSLSSGCRGDDPPPDADTGMLLLYGELITDGASDVEGYESIELDMSSIEVRGDSGPFLGLTDAHTLTIVPEMPRTFVIQLEVPVGGVGQIRFLDPVAVVNFTGRSEPVRIPSGVQSGVKIVPSDDSPDWTVEKDKAYSLTMHFELDSRLHQNEPQGLMLKPTVKATWSPINADSTPILPGLGQLEFVAGTSQATIDALNAGIGATIIDRGHRSNVVLVRLLNSVSIAQAGEYYREKSAVVAMSPVLLTTDNLVDNPGLGTIIPNDNDPLDSDGDANPATGTPAAYTLANMTTAWRTLDNDDDGVINGSVGNPSIIVAVIDSDFDLTHPDMVRSYYINNGEIPPAINAAIVDVDGLAAVTFVDLNNAANTCTAATGPCPCIVDTNANAGGDFCDPLDLINDPRWSDNADQDGNGRMDDLVGFGFGGNDAAETNIAHHSSAVANSHGMAVASIVAAVGDNRNVAGSTNAAAIAFGDAAANTGVAGVAWSVRLLPLSYAGGDFSFDSNRISEGFIDFDMREAIEYAVAQGAHIISMSADSVIVNNTDPFDALGADCPKFLQGSLGEIPAKDAARTEVMNEIRNYWQGVDLGSSVFVGAPGNCAMNLDDDNITSVPLELLDRAQTIIVTASENNAANLTNYAPFGATLELAGPTGIPGLRTGSQTRTTLFTGTSAVAPLVAGSIALFLDANVIDTPGYLGVTSAAQIKTQFLGRTSTTLSIANIGAGTDNFLDAARATNLP